MPKETFINLPKSKQQSITEAIQKAFLDKPMTKITVSDIVKYAAIPRGSFYQYFEDLEDVFKFLVDYSLKAFEEVVLDRVSQQDIPFFNYLKEALEKDYYFFENSPHQKIVSKFFSHSASYTVDFDSYIKRRENLHKKIIAYLDLTELDFLSNDQIYTIYTQLNQMKMQYIQKIMKNTISLNEAQDTYYWFIEVFRKGLKGN